MPNPHCDLVYAKNVGATQLVPVTRVNIPRSRFVKLVINPISLGMKRISLLPGKEFHAKEIVSIFQ